MVAPIAQWHDAPRTAFDDTLRIDAFGNGARLLIFAAGLLAVVVAWGMPHLADRAVEYHALLLAAGAGMSLLAVSNSLVIAFIALELFSIALYVLVAIDVDAARRAWRARSSTWSWARWARPSCCTASALVYGATGQFEFDLIAQAIRRGDAHGGVLLLGIAMIMVGLGFKANVGAVPHVDAGRVRGRAHPVTAFMSAATKTMALVLAFRVLVAAFGEDSAIWQDAIGALAVASFAVGNLAALRQANVKRMLAYSTIGHTGFLFTAVAVHSEAAARACSTTWPSTR